VGPHRAMEMILMGDHVTAQRAKEMGLVLDVFPQEGFLKEVTKKAEKLGRKGVLSLLTAKRIVRSKHSAEKERGYLLERESFATLFSSPEPKEGMKAFLEKREPDFYKS